MTRKLRIVPVLAQLTWIWYVVLMLLLTQTYAQQKQDPMLLSVAGEEVPLSEFLRIYNKNNIKGEPASLQALEEYLELYINFKLKVREALDLKMDTVKSFQEELAGYRKQLAEPYLTDREVDEFLVQEAWDRLQYDLRASHILLRLLPDATPQDTLIAYNKALELRKRILKGEDFGALAMEASEDPSARDREASRMHPFLKGNRGDLGYFTALDMVYPFETAAYNTRPGDVSMPVRTDYGYHLIKITDRQPAMGRVRVAHIFARFPQDPSEGDSLDARRKIDEAYQKILAGAAFDSIVEQYSDDKGSAKKGGQLSWFGSNRMVPEFISAVSQLHEIDQISPPVKTDYGWHIIRMLERQPVGTFQEEEPGLRKRIMKDTRAERSKASFVQKVQKQYGFKEFPAALEPYYSLVTDSIFFRSWDPSVASHLNGILFVLGESNVTQTDFTNYLNETQRNRTAMPLKQYVKEMYDEFVVAKCTAYKDARLEKEHTDFRLLMQEYHDGILLFELTDNKVWTKAIRDTAGLESYYSQHKNDYMWGDRVDVTIYKFKDQKLEKSVRSAAARALKKGQSHEVALAKILKKYPQAVTADRKKFSRGDDAWIDGLPWQPGLSPTRDNQGTFAIAAVHQFLPPEPKKLEECRGLVTADYQNFLEKEWIRELRSRYPVKVNKDVLSQGR